MNTLSAVDGTPLLPLSLCIRTGGTIATESEADFIIATNQIFHDQARPSHLILPIIVRE